MEGREYYDGRKWQMKLSGLKIAHWGGEEYLTGKFSDFDYSNQLSGKMQGTQKMQDKIWHWTNLTHNSHQYR